MRDAVYPIIILCSKNYRSSVVDVATVPAIIKVKSKVKLY